MELAFEDINVFSGNNHILKNVFGLAQTGRMLVVMGPSGAGKSTLLNVITGNMKVTSGRILFNGQPFAKKHKRKIGYVSQSDTFFPTLTLMETLWFAALCKLSDKLSYDEKLSKVNDIIATLKLEKCVNTIVGDIFTPGLSGGEKRRLSIAVELLSNPSLLVLDEPTSGLDSAIAASLVTLMKNLSQEEGRAVITTIHQPSSQMFYMFDNLLLLSGGQVAYFGLAKEALDFVTKLGFGTQFSYNPSDYIMEKMKDDKYCLQAMIDQMDINRRSKEWCADSFLTKDYIPKSSSAVTLMKESEKSYLLEKLRNGGKKTTGMYDVEMMESEIDSKTFSVVEAEDGPAWQTSFLTQWKALTVRAFKIGKYRMLSKMKFITQIVVTLYVIAIWTRLKATEGDLPNRRGVLFFLVMNWQFPTCIDQISSIILEGAVVNKERVRGWYKLSAYFLSKIGSELPLIIIIPILQVTVIYWVIGLPSNAASYFEIMAIILLMTFAAMSLGMMVGIIFSKIDLATNIGATGLVLIMLLSGFFQRNIPHWLVWLRYLSFNYYALEALTRVDIKYGGPFKCAPAIESTFAVCETANTTGYITEEDYYNQVWSLPLWVDYLILVCIPFIVFAANYVLLRIIRRQVY